jgi:archaetidylinositol phosphate synthase
MDRGRKPTHIREQRSLLAASEKRALIWLAERMPERVNSDHLTTIGFLGMVMAGTAFWAAAREPRCLFLVVAGLAINWFGDSLDGTLARVRDNQRPRYGYYTDHVLDLIGTAALVGGMALSGYMSPLVALGFLVTFFMVMAEVFLCTHVLRVFRMSFMKFGPTEMRVLLAAGSVAILYRPVVWIAGAGPFLLLDLGGVAGMAALILTLLVSALRNIHTLYREEPLVH